MYYGGRGGCKVTVVCRALGAATVIVVAIGGEEDEATGRVGEGSAQGGRE